MRIVDYDDADPLQVLHLNLLCLGFALTPELVHVIRNMDPRPVPGLAVYAVQGRTVAGQVGVFRLPVVSALGAEEVGGVWAVSTHPAFRGQGVASMLLDEAHARMAAAGLRFSTLGTDSFRVAHRLYEKHGYRDLHSPALALGRSDALPRQSGLRAELAGIDRLSLADRLFEQIASGHLGFARRHSPFFSFLHMRGYLNAQNLWLLWQGDHAMGYAAAFMKGALLQVESLLLFKSVDVLAAAAALAQATKAHYVHIRLDRPGDAAVFSRAGFHVAQPSWGTFMVKPLAAKATVEEFRQRYGVESGRFLISFVDVT